MMEILIINNYKTVYNKEFTNRDYIKFMGKGLLIALTIITLTDANAILVADLVKDAFKTQGVPKTLLLNSMMEEMEQCI